METPSANISDQLLLYLMVSLYINLGSKCFLLCGLDKRGDLFYSCFTTADALALTW